MKLLLSLLCLVVAASARPQWWRPQPSRGSASGEAGAQVTSGQSNGSNISSVQAFAQGSSSNGGTSTNNAVASQSSTSGLFGNSNQANTQAQSVQTTNSNSFNRLPVNNRPFNNRWSNRPNRFNRWG